MNKDIVIAFHRFGPYHIARLRAASAYMPIVPLEFSRFDNVYQWEQVADSLEGRRITLFNTKDVEERSSDAINEAISSTLDRVNPIAVVVPGWSARAATAMLRWACRRRRAAVLMSESTFFDRPRRYAREVVKRRIVRLFSAALVGGNHHRDYLIQLGMPAERIYDGYDAVDNQFFSTNVDICRQHEFRMRHEYNLPGKYFLASGRFVRAKNLDTLLTAYEKFRGICAEGRQWKLVLLGDGELRPELEAICRHLKIEHDVIMPGFIQYHQLSAYYGCASAFVHVAAHEPWGLVVNEAMASGLPVIVSKQSGCARNLVADGVNGFTFDVLDSGRLLPELMCQVVAIGEGERSRMGRYGRTIIAAWGVERFAAGLQSAVEVALELPQRSTAWVDRMLLAALMRC